MRAASLFGVLAIARLIALAGREIPLSIWTPVVYLWQDILVALLFAAADKAIRREWIGWLLYGAIVCYTAVNVPVTMVLSSPLTWTMIRGARGALMDSIRYYLTAQNLAALGAVLAAGILLPLLTARYRAGLEKLGKPAVIVSCAITAFGPFAVTQVDTRGLHRNAIGALWPVNADVATPVSFASFASGRRIGQSVPSPTEDLSRFRGTAAGRNVVLIVLESTGAQYLQPFGAANDPMPNLTGMARRSILFENAYAVYPESIKGLFTTLCSRYPALDRPAEFLKQIPCAALSQVLRQAGYRTALFHSGRFMYLGMESVIENRGFMTLEDAGAIGGNINSSFGVDEPAAVQRMLNWVDTLPQGQRFFLTYLPIAGHHPYASPESGPFAGESEIIRYRNALHYGDRALGEFLRGLRTRGLDENTLFVVLGDHGEAFEQHDGNVGHTMFIYEENIHVPYIIAAPGLIQTEIRVLRTASLIDTAPTILDLLGLPIPSVYQGASLLDPSGRMAFFFTDYSLRLLGLRDACRKYIYEIDSSRSRLYNICDDPGETSDLSETETEPVRMYRKSLGWR